MLVALLAENEGIKDEEEEEEEQGGQEQADDLDKLFDEDTDDEEFNDGVEGEGQDAGRGEDELLELFGDVDDIEEEEKKTGRKERGGEASREQTNQDLQGL